MLVLKNIKKDYVGKTETVHALKGVDIAFRKCEFVSILGPSGCGKTTLLNILGGLDHYTEGDLVINGRSTKEYKDSDWDSYRNHRVGFVFQSYNLISHQTVLANVELALTLSGVSKSERKKRAMEALTQVGLADQAHKKPNQLSGGQMQRVAIARALVNNPDILLADEPTGALDTGTSIQVMDILKQVAKDRLVVMVTHNPELAEKYSTRIVKLLDGKIIDDTDPYDCENEEENKALREKKPTMSFKTAFGLSLNNLMTKKRRTILTAFAGSIGIIGIALILSLSTGFQDYIDSVESQTLSNYPITVESQTVDFSSFMGTLMEAGEAEREEHELDKIYSSNVMGELLNTMMSEVKSNDMAGFKSFLEEKQPDMEDSISGIEYIYDLDLQVYSADTSNGVVQVNPSPIIEKVTGSSDLMQMSNMMSSMGSSSSSQYSNMDVFSQLLNNEELLKSQYEVVSGDWPNEYDEVVLIVSRRNEISDMTLYTLGLRDQSEVEGMMQVIMEGGDASKDIISFEYDELVGLEFKLIMPQDRYEKDENGVWIDRSGDKTFLKNAVDNGVTLRVSGIIRPQEGSVSGGQYGSIAYTPELMDFYMEQLNDSEILKDQLDDPDTDIFTGVPFSSGDEPKEEKEVTMEDVNAYIESMPESERAKIEPYLGAMSEEQIIAMFKEQMPPKTTDATYDGNLKLLGMTDPEKPSLINIYPVDFEAKDRISDLITEYNDAKRAEGNEDAAISYTDYVGMLMSNVTKIVNTISYVLIAFVAISLVVSSIMIGVITNISVLERTKEIGILHSIGASKRDISHVFNAETFIVGLAAGLFGVIITAILCIPINAIIYSLAGIKNVATLRFLPALILVLISVVLTLIAGLIPARNAAKKDPVEALRTE